MRSHEKHRDKFPGKEEVLQSIDEHEDLRTTGITSRVIQQILDI